MNRAPCPRCTAAGNVSDGSDVMLHRALSRWRIDKYEDSETFFDEEGNMHYHNPNVTTLIYRCSERHYWTESSMNGCGSCDFGSTELEIVDMTHKIRS